MLSKTVRGKGVIFVLFFEKNIVIYCVSDINFHFGFGLYCFSARVLVRNVIVPNKDFLKFFLYILFRKNITYFSKKYQNSKLFFFLKAFNIIDHSTSISLLFLKASHFLSNYALTLSKKILLDPKKKGFFN